MTALSYGSVAGLRAGIADERGNLALEFMRLAWRLRPEWVVWENVPGVLSSNRGRDFAAIVGALGELGYGVAWRVLDAQHFGVPQRRRRVFVVGCLGGWKPAAAVLFERDCLSGDSAPGRSAAAGFAVGPLLGSSSRRRGCGAVTEAASGQLVQAYRTSPNCGAWSTGDRVDALTTGTDRASHVLAYGGNRTSGPIDVATALTAHGGPAGRLDFASETFVDSGLGVRRLTPRECERLQGFPDDWTLVPYRGKSACDGPRYRAIGNSMAVPVMRWIGERIGMVDAAMRTGER